MWNNILVLSYVQSFNVVNNHAKLTGMHAPSKDRVCIREYFDGFVNSCVPLIDFVCGATSFVCQIFFRPNVTLVYMRFSSIGE